MKFKLKQYGLALNDFTMASIIDGVCYILFYVFFILISIRKDLY